MLSLNGLIGANLIAGSKYPLNIAITKLARDLHGEHHSSGFSGDFVLTDTPS